MTIAKIASFNILLLVSLTANVITLSAANQYFSEAKLHINCLKTEPTSSLSAEWGLQLFAGARFYIPFGSSKAIQHISQLIFSGRKDASSQKLCALVRIKGFKLQMEGHGDHFLTQDCAVVKKGVNHCIVNENSENPDIQKNGDGIFTIVWTDNVQSMAVVRCTSDGLFNDWYVFSFEPKLNDTVKMEVLSTMKKLGFTDTLEHDATSPSYEGCELFDPEEED